MFHNHPGAMRTVLCFMQLFASHLSQNELILRTKSIVDSCATCLAGKPNRAIDRGEVGTLPTPLLGNDILHNDFIAMDDYNGHDYILTCVDALTHFCQFWPCQKSLTGEGVIWILLER